MRPLLVVATSESVSAVDMDRLVVNERAGFNRGTAKAAPSRWQTTRIATNSKDVIVIVLVEVDDRTVFEECQPLGPDILFFVEKNCGANDSLHGVTVSCSVSLFLPFCARIVFCLCDAPLWVPD